MKVVRERIEKDFAEIAKYGALDNGGVTRLAFSEADLKARRYILQAMEDAGLQVGLDAAGNQRGLRAGRENLTPVLIGSHLDTVPGGGHFDGVVGVLAALETVRVFNDQALITRRPIEVINFSAEESSRFGVATLGSKAMVGALCPEDLDRLVDNEGISLRQALTGAGCLLRDLDTARIRKGDIHAFLEVHIEQGPVLEREKRPVGIVTAIAAPTRLKVVVNGRADHSGATPMTMRRDALAGASELVLGVERIAGHEAGENTVGTVGYLRVAPGVMNVVPERVEMGIDLRDIVGENKRMAVSGVVDLMTKVAERRNLIIDWEVISDEDPVPLSKKVIAGIEKAAGDSGLPYLKLPSGAGHDAMNMARITDAGMIFIPSLGGISHNRAERSRFEDICRGTEVLLRAVASLAQEQ